MALSSAGALAMRCGMLRGGLALPRLQWPRCSRPCATQALPQRPALKGHPVVYHPDFAINPIQEGHRFPMPKDHLLYLRLQQLGLAENTFTPQVPDVDTLALCHDREYVEAFIAGSLPRPAMQRIGLPWSPALVRRTLIGVGSAVLAARLALQWGVACMTNGGTHHAHPAHGGGWCALNDLAVAVRAAQRDCGLGTALILDLDVHQGDGTAAIFAGDPSVFTCSVHCAAQSFPHTLHASDLDVALPAGTGDAEYLAALRQLLPGLLARVQPQLVAYNAGVDVHAADSLGKMALSDQGIAERDAFVLACCASAGVPVAVAIGGGYEEEHANIVERHVLLHRAASEQLPQLVRSGRMARKLMLAEARDGKELLRPLQQQQQ